MENEVNNELPVLPPTLPTEPVKAESTLLRDSAILGLLLITIGFLIFPFEPEAAETKVEPVPENVQDFSNPFSSIQLVARSAYVLDTATGEVLFARNENAELPLASLTKVMTVVTALSLIPEYATVRIDRDALKEEGDTGLYVDEQWKLNDLSSFVLLTSSNDGARALAILGGSLPSPRGENADPVRVFVDAMNAKARALGLSNMRFYNPTGLDLDPMTPGAYGSAKDVGRLFEYAIKRYPQIFQDTGRSEKTYQSLSGLTHNATNTNGAVNLVPIMVGSKTGFTDLAGGNLVIAFDAGPGRSIIVAVLGSTIQGRFEDATKLAWASLEYLSQSK